MGISTQNTRAAFNPLEYGKKLAALYAEDKLLGTVTVPWGIVFMLWFFSRDDGLIQILGYLSMTVGAVAFTSAIKHIIGGFLQEHFKLKSDELVNDRIEKTKNVETITVQTEAQLDKEKTESHFQMTTLTKMLESTSGVQMILLNRSLEYIETEGDKDKTVLKLYVDTIKDLSKEMGEHNARMKLPFNEFLLDLYKDYIDTDYQPPTKDNIPQSMVTVDDIEKLGDTIESHNPTSDDLAEVDLSHVKVD